MIIFDEPLAAASANAAHPRPEGTRFAPRWQSAVSAPPPS